MLFASFTISDGKASAYNAGNLGLIPGLGRYSGEGNGNPLQYSCLGNPMDRGAWWATVSGVAKSRTQLSDFPHSLTHSLTHHFTLPLKPSQAPWDLDLGHSWSCIPLMAFAKQMLHGCGCVIYMFCGHPPTEAEHQAGSSWKWGMKMCGEKGWEGSQMLENKALAAGKRQTSRGVVGWSKEVLDNDQMG